MQYEDVRINEVPLRVYAAITLKVPKSGVGWIDSMIRDSRQHEITVSVAVLATGDARRQFDHGPNTNCSFEELQQRIYDKMLARALQE